MPTPPTPPTTTAAKTDALLADGLSGDREIVLSRTFDAPRELVWAAWTDPRHLPSWWGPRGFTTTIYAMDLRPGGTWRFCMHGPDGRNYENKVTYVEVCKPERLVFRHSGDSDSEDVSHTTTTTFEPVDGGVKTRVTLRLTFTSPAARDHVVKNYGAIEGGKQTLERLGQHLSGMPAAAAQAAPPDPDFVLSRDFDAPRELVWKAWTENDQLKQWFGPKGASITQCTNDLRPGGFFHYGMQMPPELGSKVLWGRWTYLEITPPKRLVFIVSFSDERRGVARHPFSETWPMEIRSVVMFEKIDQDKTRVTVCWSHHNATEIERSTFNAGYESMRGGWGGTMDQFQEYLGRQR